MSAPSKPPWALCSCLVIALFLGCDDSPSARPADGGASSDVGQVDLDAAGDGEAGAGDSGTKDSGNGDGGAGTDGGGGLTMLGENGWGKPYGQILHTDKTYPGDLLKNGFIDASKRAGVDPSGTSDSTAGLQKAISDGIDQAKVTYLPAGTYLVSDTLTGLQVYNTSGCAKSLWSYLYAGNSIRKAGVLIGGLGDKRPVIRLKDNSAGFGDKKNPRPVIRFYNNRDNKWEGGADCHMSAAIRGIEVVVGSGNPGAIGIEFPAAQYSTLEDVKVDATGGYAGIRGVPSVNINVGVEVIGGDYGIMPEICCGISFVGVKLRNQLKAALKVKSYAPVGMTGFEIEVSQGAAILVTSGGGAHTSQLALLDGIIRSSSSAPAIDNSFGSDLHINNVFVKGNAALVRSGANTTTGDKAKWSHIEEYSYTDQRVISRNGLTLGSEKLVDGKKSKATITAVKTVTAPPPSVAARHLWSHMPSLYGKSVFNVVADGNAKGDGQADDTQALQGAINAHKVVFLPVGDYQISATLQLKKDTQLFGAPGAKSRLFAKSWKPTTFTPMIRTVDDAQATNYIGDIYIMLPQGKERTYLSALDWRAGKRSWVRHLYIDMQWSNADYAAHGRKLIDVSGSGGGRFYGTTMHLLSGGNNSDHPEHRLLYLHGTQQPITFYGSNLEHSKTTQIEIKQSQNVRIIGGMKFESFDALKMSGSSNVMISGLAGHATLMRIEGSNNILIPIFANYNSLKSKVKDPFMFSETYGGKTHGVKAADNMSLFKRGSFDLSAFD